MTRYTSVSFSQVNSWRRAAVLDGVKADGHMLTQVIGYDEASDRLISPLSNEENATDRPTAAAAVSRDVNKDGILEIPTAELTINGSETTADSTGYVITWNTYSLQDNTLTPVCTSILNTAENYNLFLPSSEDNYGCQNDTVTRTATFLRIHRSALTAITSAGRISSPFGYIRRKTGRKKNRMTKIFC